MLKFTMAASLLAMTLSVDAFAAKPDQDDQKGNITYTYKGPENTQQPEDRELSEEDDIRSLVSRPFMTEEELRNFLSEWEKELALTRQKLIADFERRLQELAGEALAEFEAHQRNFVPYEHQLLPSRDFSTLLEKKDAE